VYYRYAVDKLTTGASYGNYETYLHLTPQSDVSGLWSALDNQYYCGRWVAQCYVHGQKAIPLETVLAPAYQETTFTVDGLQIRKRTFLPMRGEHMQAVYMIIEIDNPGDRPCDVAIICDIHYPAFVWPNSYKVPDQTQRNKRVEHKEQNHSNAVISTTIGRDDEVRVFGTSEQSVTMSPTDRGFSRTYRVPVAPHDSTRASFRMAFSGKGERAALATYKKSPSPQVALDQAIDFYDDILARGIVRTPDATINRAIDWAKINTARVQHRFPAGFGFTNDPSQDIVVVRDAAWYILGSDYVTPNFSRGILEMIAAHGIEPGGKVTEFIEACTDPPQISDYDLNINDDTPLIVCAVYHHYAVTRDRETLKRLWPMVRGACDWIIAQMRSDLVYSHSIEANVWGISGWRNILPQSQISGAVTEINAECAYALRLGSQLAREMGDAQARDRYADAADRLKDAINSILVSDRTGLYLLNIDPEGEKHHDLTGDQIFPVLFGIADEDRKRRILDTLYSPEFWTPFGVRTVGKHQEAFDPEHGVQLLGGVWPNLTAWVAYSSKSYSPRRLVSGMRNIWKISEVENPKAYQNVVPGLFPERLSGQNFKSRGMTMSPWMPPTYLWLAYEGLLGFEPRLDGLHVNPHLPTEWKWVGARNLRYAGTHLSCFFYRRTLFTTMPVASRSKCVVMDEDVTHHIVSDAPFYVALRDGERALIFVGTDEAGTYRVAVMPPLSASEEEIIVELRAGDAKLITLKKRS
jgi:hypothetical protein